MRLGQDRHRTYVKNVFLPLVLATLEHFGVNTLTMKAPVRVSLINMLT